MARRFGAWLEAEGARRGVAVFTEKAGVNTVVVDSTDDLDGLLANLAFSFTLYSGQMCTTPQNVYVPRDGITTDAGPLTFDELGQPAGRSRHGPDRRRRQGGRAARRHGQRRGPDRAGSRRRSGRIGRVRAGRVVLDSRVVAHPTYPDAVVRTPALVALDVADEEVYRQECFGPVAFLIATDSTAQSLRTFVDTVREHGAMTAAVYSDLGRGARRRPGRGRGRRRVAVREPHRPGLRQPDLGVQRLPRHRGQPGGQRGVRRRRVRRPRFRVVTTRRHA